MTCVTGELVKCWICNGCKPKAFANDFNAARRQPNVPAEHWLELNLNIERGQVTDLFMVDSVYYIVSPLSQKLETGSLLPTPPPSAACARYNIALHENPTT